MQAINFDKRRLVCSHILIKVDEVGLPIPMWPNGTIIKELLLEETFQGLHKMQWAWINNRTDKPDPITGVKTTTYFCQGVWHCISDDCQWTLRPCIRRTDFEKQKGSHLFLQYLLSTRESGLATSRAGPSLGSARLGRAELRCC
jgi:hypothetical protein